MSLAKTWYSVADAESKFGVPKALILKWVDEGLVRCEQEDGTVVSVNGDDLELKVDEYVKKG
ncbi:MAG: MerR family transcriptional regulator [Geobacteraceae bacterium]|nr:MerR family transcriptional regulator [Geobacteraceae bacterium]